MPIQTQGGVAKSFCWLIAPVSAGILLHAYEFMLASPSGSRGFALGLLAWSALPFVVALAMSKLGVKASRAAGYACASLAGSLYMHYAVFVQPTASTAALGLLFMPLWNLILLGPAVLLIAWGIEASKSGARHNAD